MSVRDRVISLLGQGFSNTTVASAVGVTPAYISQLLDDPEVFNEVSALRANRLEAGAKVDAKIEDLEGRALQLVADKMAYVRSPLEAVKIFATLNAAKKKTGDIAAGQDTSGLATVTVTLPKVLANNGTINIQLNTSNQVVEVEGKSMAPLPSRALSQLSAPKLLVEDVTPVPSAKNITEEAVRQQQRRDMARAAKILENVSQPVKTMIDGVECVL